MGEITTIGLDLATSVFQVHAVGSDGKVVLRRHLRRSQMLEFFARLAPSLIGIKACAGAQSRAQYRARELGAGTGRGNWRSTGRGNWPGPGTTCG